MRNGPLPTWPEGKILGTELLDPERPSHPPQLQMQSPQQNPRIPHQQQQCLIPPAAQHSLAQPLPQPSKPPSRMHPTCRNITGGESTETWAVGGGRPGLVHRWDPRDSPPPQGNLNPKPGHAPSTAAGHGKVMNSHRDRDGDKGNQHGGRR